MRTTIYKQLDIYNFNKILEHLGSRNAFIDFKVVKWQLGLNQIK